MSGEQFKVEANSNQKSSLIPVVLSGGLGTRLWPLSRATLPKQFCELLDESLLDKTLRRLQRLSSPWVLTTQELESLTRRSYRQLHFPQEQILFEPIGRNTAPATAFLCRYFELLGKADAIIGVFPADHLVLNEEAFESALRIASQAAEQGYLVTLGIQPDQPATGFGYIQTEAISSSSSSAAFVPVLAFHEKPDRKTAEKYLSAGNFYWNAGIFVFRVSSMIENFKKFLPDLWQSMQDLDLSLQGLKEIYSRAPSISLDYAIMEKADKQVCVPCSIGWSDMGSWDDIARLEDGINLQNRAHVVLTEKSRDNFVYSAENKVCGLVDVDNLIVIDTTDALMIARRGSTQNVRQVVDQLSRIRHLTSREHRFEIRPWGRFTILRDEEHYKSKLIQLDPHARLSYQSHTKRREHWIVVQGEGQVTLDGKLITVKAGDSIMIPIGAKHRIHNAQDKILEFVEVQTGDYFGEDDIIRYQDDYGDASRQPHNVEKL